MRVCVNRSFCLSVNGRRIQCLPPARYTVALMDRMLNRCVFLCTRVRVCVWDGERMCWALLAADLEEFQLHWKGLMLLGFLSCVCVICMCTFEELRMIVHEGTFALVSRNPCCVSLWSVFSLMWCWSCTVSVWVFLWDVQWSYHVLAFIRPVLG